MNTQKNGGSRAAERGCAWIVTILLTLLLAAAILGSAVLQMMTSAGLHLSVAADDSMLDKQFRSICENIDVMADEYGFSADAVKATISREELKEMNRKSAEWWTRLLTEGEDTTLPRWHNSSIEDVIYAEAEEKELGETPRTIVTDLTEMIENTVFPVRETLIGFGTKIAKDKADIRGIVQTVRKVPMLCLALGLACAGLIALLLGREPARYLKHYGTAAAAAGLIVLASCISFLVSRPTALLEEASKGLAAEFETMMGKTGTGTGLAAAVLLIAGYACLILYRRKAGKNNKITEQAE